MSSFSVKLDNKRSCRYVFASHLWNTKLNTSSRLIPTLLDTGAFNTIVHKALLKDCGIMLNRCMKTSIGGFKGEANICILNKLQIGGHTLENIVALAVPFEGELKDHILLGANVLNNWKFTLSRFENKLEVTEQFSESALQRTFPYRYCFNNSGQVMALQEFDEIED